MFPDANVLTWNEVEKLQRWGHEVASHGVRHVDLNLCNRSEKELEINGSYKIFESHGVNVNTYACAFNAYDKECVTIGGKHYKSFREHVGYNEYPPKTFTYHAMTPNAVDEAINYKNNDRWYIGIWHDPNLKSFEEQVNRVRDAGLNVITVNQAYGI